ncbi:MAG TPA: ABC transporter permease [Candidatus Acidoferrales bacterium]|nr:ABC transporter permease [Candidatus Acidoferrales bacterium]
MDALLQDIRYAFRLMGKNRGFTFIVIFTLALGIGANTAIFSVVNAVLLRSLPFPDSNRLVKVSFGNPGVGLHDVPFSYPEFTDIREKSAVFDEVSVVWPSNGNLTGAKSPVRLELLAVSPNYFSMLGTVPELGRLFDSRDTALGFADAAVISDGLWRRSYGADPSVIGRKLQIDNDPYTIIGVAPPTFHHPGKTISGDVEVWLTAGFSADPFSSKRNEREIAGAMARLKPGLTVEKAQAALATLAESVQRDFPNDYTKDGKWSINIQPLQQTLVGDVRPTLWMLLCAVVLIVVLTSVNIANLLLARGAGRRHEVAVRLAMGSTRSRIMRQALTESVILSLIAGVAGVLAASGTIGFILHFVPAKIPRLNEVTIDWTVLSFALLISVFCGLLFGMLPALQSFKVDQFTVIREGTKSGAQSGARTSRLRGALIASEVSLALLLMVGAGLLLRTLWDLLQENPGFNPAQIVTAGVWLPAPNNPKTDPYVDVAHQNVFIREALTRLRAIPGIEAAAISSSLPASGGRTALASVRLEGKPPEAAADRAEIIRVSPDYFRVMQASLLKGRIFAEEDVLGKDPVVVLDQTTAHRYWPDVEAVGQHMKVSGFGGTQIPATVIGVIADIKHDGLDRDGVPHLYSSIYQRYGKVLTVLVRTQLPSSSLESGIRGAIQSVDPNLPVFGVRSMDSVIDTSLSSRRFSAELVGAFAGLALLLACIGIYGLLAYMVGQRTQEIGVRMALGAKRTNIVGLFVSNGLLLAGVGVLVGLVAALILTPLMATLLYGVQPRDFSVFLTVPLILLMMAIVASAVPALRASRINPYEALREG